MLMSSYWCSCIVIMWGSCRMMSIMSAASGFSLLGIFPFIFLLRILRLVMRVPASLRFVVVVDSVFSFRL